MEGPTSLAAATVVELRRYELRPGGFTTLARLFDDHFIAGQQAAGMCVGTVYADLDRPDSFVWWRGFVDMADRLRALTDFYDGPIWAAHRDDANATMLDSDNVLLLRHTDPPHVATVHERAGATATMIVHGEPPHARPHEFLETVLRVPVSTWRTEPAANTFPRLPVRDASVFVWSADFPDEDAMTEALHRLDDDPEWTKDAELLRLRPVIA